MKFKKLFAVMALFVPAAALISAGCKDEKPKPKPNPEQTPKLDALKAFAAENTDEKLKAKHNLTFLAVPTVNVDDISKDKKVMGNDDYHVYLTAWNKANAVIKEEEAEQAKKDLEKAIVAFEAAIKIGTGCLEDSIKFLEKYMKVDTQKLVEKAANSLMGATFSQKKLIIPENLNGSVISEIGDGAFINLEIQLEEIEFRAKITKIGASAFYYTTLTNTTGKINKFVAPSSLKIIGYSAFGNFRCDELILPKGAKFDSSFHFFSSKIKHLVLPDDLTAIPFKAFHNAEIGELKIPETVTSIEPDAFKDATIEKLIVKKSLYDANKSEFEKANKITEIVKVE
ncbi:leucine rich repeat (LRR) protein [Metamycoplasma subdolum]|uniref:Leucine rich repeat (LRR) protein n=1 Tax=Metamycoplasma subdolum TaxID=92407 RepID=A0A3M0A132_9BACT|nr:leucine-rich repeat domain-containing protein [Metamycoplasma subdolum]RMA78480.1 leucine rich repeat (LRR) protein [Metamycoplasma subdolum]WPB50412.1 leucine-rich repeat domain-containing protein [Metamycoplasma subdolum]